MNRSGFPPLQSTQTPPFAPATGAQPLPRPSAPIHTAAPEQAVVVWTRPPQPEMFFDDRALPEEVQKVIASFFDNPREALTGQAIRAALRTFKAMSEVNRSFNRFALPLRHATFLRLFGQGLVKTVSLEDWPLNLPLMLESIVARSGLSGLQCLSDLVNGSLGGTPVQDERAFDHWVGLLARLPPSTAEAHGGVPFHLLPAVLGVRLGQMPGQGSLSPMHSLLLMKRLIELSKKLPTSTAESLLFETLLLARAKEIGTGSAFMGHSTGAGAMKWMSFHSSEVREAMQAHGQLPEDAGRSVQALAEVLSLRHGYVRNIDAATIECALNFLVSYPHPLMGCMAKVPGIVATLTGKSARIEELLALCNKKIV